MNKVGSPGWITRLDIGSAPVWVFFFYPEYRGKRAVAFSHLAQRLISEAIRSY